MRFPAPLRPGDTIGVTAPSAGIRPSYLPRLEFARDWLGTRGYDLRLGDCLVTADGGVTGPPERRAAELTAMLVDPSVRAVVPPWGGELAIQVLEHLDWDAIAAAEPTWVVGFSDLTTLMVPLATRAGWASLHGANLMDTPYDQPDGLAHWLDVLESGAAVTQRSPGRYRTGPWDDYEADPKVAGQRELDTSGRWEVAGGGGVDVTGRLLGGCIEVLAPLVGTPYADVPEFGRSLAEDGLIVYVEACEAVSYDIGRALHGMRLAGWFDEANAVLVGRTSAPGREDYSQRDAALDALSPLDVPVVLDVDFGHVWPYLPMVNGALGHVVVDERRAELTQTWP